MKKIVPTSAVLIPDTATRVFEGQIFDVYQWPQTLFDGSTATFEMLKRPDTVLFVCIKDDKIIFIREQQPGRDEYVRLPGGRVDPGEDWRTAAERECAVELGLRFKNWRLLAVRQPVAKVEWFVATYLGTDCIEEHGTHHDAGERIESVPMSFAEAKEYVLDVDDRSTEHIRELFENAGSLDDLKVLPQFQGKEVDR